MANRDYEIRTPVNNILLCTYREQVDGACRFVVRKGGKEEKLTMMEIMEMILNAAEHKQEQVK